MNIKSNKKRYYKWKYNTMWERCQALVYNSVAELRDNKFIK